MNCSPQTMDFIVAIYNPLVPVVLLTLSLGYPRANMMQISADSWFCFAFSGSLKNSAVWWDQRSIHLLRQPALAAVPPLHADAFSEAVQWRSTTKRGTQEEDDRTNRTRGLKQRKATRHTRHSGILPEMALSTLTSKTNRETEQREDNEDGDWEKGLGKKFQSPMHSTTIDILILKISTFELEPIAALSTSSQVRYATYQDTKRMYTLDPNCNWRKYTFLPWQAEVGNKHGTITGWVAAHSARGSTQSLPLSPPWPRSLEGTTKILNWGKSLWVRINHSLTRHSFASLHSWSLIP